MKKKEIISIKANFNDIKWKTIEKLNKSLFFKNINKIDKLLARLIKEERMGTQIMNIRNKRGHVLTDLIDIKKVIGNIIYNFMPVKYNNLYYLDKFFLKDTCLSLTNI